MGNSGYHGLKDRRQRPVEQGAVTGYVGLSLLAAGVLGCVLFFSGVFIDEEVLLNIPPKPVVEKVYEHPRSCFDAGTSLFRISGSERQPITELQMIKMLKATAPLHLLTVMMSTEATTSRCFPGRNVSAMLHLRGQSSDGEVVIQHMCRCLSSFDAFLDASTSFEKAEQASSLTLDSIVDLGANVGMASLSFSFNHPEATIVAIEAGIHNYIGLRANVGHSKKIHTELAAIWDSDGFTKLNGSIVSQQSQNFSDWATTVAEVQNVGDMQGMAITDLVTALSVPSLMERFGLKTIDILKVDIEGAEVVLFTDKAKEWLPHVWCILMEVHAFVWGREGDAIPKNWSSLTLEPLLYPQGFKKEMQWGEYDIYCKPRDTVVPLVDPAAARLTGSVEIAEELLATPENKRSSRRFRLRGLRS